MGAPNILQKIYDYKQEELAHFKRQVSFADIKAQALDKEVPIDFASAFLEQNHEIKVIAEVKKKSPSKGLLCEHFDPLKIALAYEQGGAKAISVLTDEHFFAGSLEYLRLITQNVDLPCLRKDFIWDEYQIYEAREAGASAILLIVAMLDSEGQMQDLQGCAHDLGLKVLLEVHTEEEYAKGSMIKPDLIGVNNRDLKTFKVDLETTRNILKLKQDQTPLISESGLKDQRTLLQLMSEGVAGFLIGESLVTQKSPEQALKKLVEVKTL